ncbi:Inorganic pyrophosphatase [Grifola frondosa]|uniref:inorganic diphosphatase n=1 Tax=Grifola frondosa TaxID=5627 RepID=A0A1C7MSA8_GRIFR|nr:Inorganic pyrophosphatase [Grifola frondosa]
MHWCKSEKNEHASRLVRLLSATTTMASQYTTRLIGAPNTLEHRVFIEQNGNVVSPFHDIPLFADQNNGILNMVVEVPRWTNAKMEISKEESFNPIKQDIKKGRLRYVRNCFPHHGYIWNYGAFPRPGKTLPRLTRRPKPMVTTTRSTSVKVLGIMALLDEGETDWKVLVIDVRDPLASRLNDIEDVERHFPGLVRATNEWFRIYKIPDGKPENHGESPAKTPNYDISIRNISVQNSPGYVSKNDPAYTSLPPDSRKAPAPVDPSISKWFYISSAQSSELHCPRL